MGNFPLFPHPGCPDDDFQKCNFTLGNRMLPRVPGTAEARVGYFALNLTNNVRAEITASKRASLYRFTFPTDRDDTSVSRGARANPPLSPLLLVDLQDLGQTALSSSSGCQVYPATGRIIGEGAFLPSFGRGTYHSYFCADFRGAAVRRAGTFMGEDARTNVTHLNAVERGFANPSGSGGAWVQFDPLSAGGNGQILARVGLSFISVDQACANAERELPDFDFDGAVRDVEMAWSEKLGVIELETKGVHPDMQTIFWSGLYRSMLSPQNYTGENQLWESTEPYFDSFYCIWDSFRAQHPLLTIMDPAAQTEMVRALLDIYRHEGKLPDCRMSFSKGFTQGGSNADVVITDAYIKGITEGIDWKTAYEAVISDAEGE